MQRARGDRGQCRDRHRPDHWYAHQKPRQEAANQDGDGHRCIRPISRGSASRQRQMPSTGAAADWTTPGQRSNGVGTQPKRLIVAMPLTKSAIPISSRTSAASLSSSAQIRARHWRAALRMPRSHGAARPVRRPGMWSRRRRCRRPRPTHSRPVIPRKRVATASRVATTITSSAATPKTASGRRVISPARRQRHPERTACPRPLRSGHRPGRRLPGTAPARPC